MLSFAEQALRYFDRPHEGIPYGPIGGPAAWRGEDLAGRADWIVTLDEAAIDEIDRACDAADALGVGPGAISRADFVLPSLSERVRAWANEILHGRGFLVVRGLPVERWGDERAALAFEGLGVHLGRPGAQNPAGDVLGHVVDTGEDADNPFVRRYRTSGDISWHCDLADAVGLLCLRTSRSGGGSRIVSSVGIFDELARRRPDLAARLFEPVALDLRDEGRSGPGWIPAVPCRHARGEMRTFYHADYFRSAARHPDAPLGPVERELFDVYEAIADESGRALEMRFRPGDLQLLSNHVVLHGRDAYEDGPEPAQRRHLLRLWLTLDVDGA